MYEVIRTYCTSHPVISTRQVENSISEAKIQGVCSYGRMPFLIGGMSMNDMEFIEALKTKRNACGYSQSRLAKELHISRQNLNEIENGKTSASKEMKHMLLHYLDYCNCTQPFTCFLASNFPHFHRYDSLKSALYIHAVSKNINTFPKNQGRIRAAIAVEILDFTVMYR